MDMQYEHQINSIILFIIIGISMAIKLIITNYTVIKLFSVKKQNMMKIFVFQYALLLILKTIIPQDYIKVMDIIIIIVSYIIFFKMHFEKAILAEEINVILLCIFESVFAKIYSIIFSMSYLPSEINVLIYKSLISISPIILKLVLYHIINSKNIKIDIDEDIEAKGKLEIMVIAICSLILIVLTEDELVNNMKMICNTMYFIINGLLVSYFWVITTTVAKISEVDKENKKIQCLEGSNERLQSNYDDVRSFRHDFNNIMQSIGGYIVTKDLEGLEKMYKSITKECQDINNKQSINKDVITDPALYNLINSKYLLAQKNDIKFKLEVLIDIKKLKVNIYDLCRILGILLDNAIEATKDCEDKTISIKFIKDKMNCRDLIIIENPCKNYLMDLSKLFEKGISSKKDSISHGLGLWRVKQILKKNKNIQIYTARADLFKQQIEIY